MRYHVTIGERVLVVELGTDGVSVEGRPVTVSLAPSDGTPVRGLIIAGRSYRVLADRDGAGRWTLRQRGRVVVAEVVDERAKAIREIAGGPATPAGPAPVVAPMPGMVVKVEVDEGDVVAQGQGVAIVEAMKMENELQAGGAGVVTHVRVRKGDAVEKDQVLVEFAPLGEEAG